jgi:hypothetical protein
MTFLLDAANEYNKVLVQGNRMLSAVNTGVDVV